MDRWIDRKRERKYQIERESGKQRERERERKYQIYRESGKQRERESAAQGEAEAALLIAKAVSKNPGAVRRGGLGRGGGLDAREPIGGAGRGGCRVPRRGRVCVCAEAGT